MLPLLERFISTNYKVHVLSALIIRFVLVAYSVYHDKVSNVPYTDIDYKVFTDASRHILNKESPYDRLTYRYSPVVALFLIPNVIFNESFGKILFSFVDIIVGLLIRLIVLSNIGQYTFYKETIFKRKTNESSIQKKCKDKTEDDTIKRHLYVFDDTCHFTANVCMLTWLYNPFTIAISTRGNCDSIAGLLVLLTLYFLQCQNNCFIAGMIHGISVHFRLYPLAYSLTLFMFLSNYSYYILKNFKIKNNMMQIENEQNKTGISKKSLFKKKYVLYFIPNSDQIMLVFGCLLSLLTLIGTFYYLYGYQFLYETYIYHLIRKDIRHNFSVYFYLQYLSAYIKYIGMWQKLLVTLPQLILLLVFSFQYGLNKISLNFAILVQTVVMVTYNTVVTSQYFVWIMVILPLCLWQIKFNRKIGLLIFIWFVAQGAWLFPAYLLEFQGKNTFFFIWIQSVSFFCVNIAILGRLIMCYTPCD